VPSDETLLRTIRRIGATLAVLLAILTLHVHELYDRNWGQDVVPALLAEGVPWLVVLVSLSYLTLSVRRGVGKRIEQSDPAPLETGDGPGEETSEGATDG